MIYSTIYYDSFGGICQAKRGIVHIRTYILKVDSLGKMCYNDYRRWGNVICLRFLIKLREVRHDLIFFFLLTNGGT